MDNVQGQPGTPLVVSGVEAWQLTDIDNENVYELRRVRRRHYHEPGETAAEAVIDHFQEKHDHFTGEENQ